jgi:hypothetical protein
MNDRHEESAFQPSEAVSGRAARRNFIKNSGRIAVVAPAVVLLLSAGRANAVGTNPYGPDRFMDTAPKAAKKHLLDP